MKLNYALLLNYLIEENNIYAEELSEWLNIDRTQLSKIKCNKRNMSKSVKPDFFYECVFAQNESLTDDQGIHKLYDYLERNDCLTPFIQKAFSEYTEDKGSQEDRAKKFLLTVLAGTDRKMASSTDEIHFAKFINPIQNNVFIGRENIFKEIHEKLTQLGTCIICGIGGMGKSYCSLKYADLYSDQYSQMQQVFFSSDIRSTILKIPFDSLDESRFSEDEKLENRFSILSAFSDDTLLIIDNMDTQPVDQENYERLKNLPLHVIFTSRQSKFDSEKYFLPIQPLTRQEQLDLFKHFCEFEIEDEQLPEYYKLFEKVEGHTLLLELIAKTMSSSDATPSEMMKILSGTEDEAIDKIPIEMDNTYRQEKMNNFVSNLFDTSELTDEQKNILMHLSLASVGGVRRKLLKQYLSCKNSDDINALISQSWIISSSSVGPGSLKIHLHPVIRSAVISNTKPTIDKCEAFLRQIVGDLTASSMILKDTDVYDLCDILINAGMMLTFRAEHVKLILDIIDVLWKHMLYTGAYDYCTIGINIIEQSTETDVESQITLYEKAGKIAVRLANYKNGIKHYKTAISVIEDKCLDYPKDLADLYDNLGVVMRKASRYTDALDYLTKAQNIIDVHHINDPQLAANIYNDMGVVYINLDVYDKALHNYQKAREIRENALNPDREQIAYSYHNIGTVYQRKKDFASAIEWHKKALDIRREIYPENEPIIAASLTMIGNDYTQAAKEDDNYDFNEAQDYFSEGLEIRKAALGENHPDTAWSHQSIGKWYYYQGIYEKALEHYQKCLSIRQTALGQRHAYTAEILCAIGKVYYKLNNTALARDYLSNALEIQNSLHKVRAAEKTAALLNKL